MSILNRSLSLPLTGESFTQMLTLQQKFFLPGSLYAQFVLDKSSELKRDILKRKHLVTLSNPIMMPPRRKKWIFLLAQTIEKKTYDALLK